MPQIPVTETSCTNGRSPYWLLARELIVPVGPKDSRYSRLTMATGKTRVPAKPGTRGATSRSAAYGSIAAVMMTSTDR